MSSPSHREPLSEHPAGSLRELLVVAIPLVISTGSHAVMMFFDRLFLMRYSEEAFAASLPAGTVIWSMLAVPLGIVAYATTFVAQYHGAGDRELVRKSVWQAIGAAIVFGAVLVGLAGPVSECFRLVGHDPAVAEQERIYFLAIAWILPVRLFIAAIAAFFNGRGRTQTVMAGSLVGMVANIVLDGMLIFGVGPIPAMGIKGAAIASVLAMALNAAYLVYALFHENRQDGQLWRRAAVFDAGLSGRMLRFGVPQGLQFLFDIGSFTVVVFLVGRISQEALGATNLALQINSMLFIPLIGLGQAISTIVGHRVGEGQADLAKRSVRMAMQLGIAWTIPFVVVFVALPSWTLWPFERYAPESLGPFRNQMPTLLWFVSAFCVFDLMAVVYGAAIRGAGDTKFSLYVFMAVNWGIMVLPLVIIEWLGVNSLYRAWAVITWTIAALGIIFWLRYRGGQWQSMSVIEPDVIATEQVDHGNHREPALAERRRQADSSGRPA